MTTQTINPLVAQAMAASGFTGYLGQSLLPYYNRVYGGGVGGTNHLVALDKDATRQGEAPAGMPISTVGLPSGLVKPERIRLTIDTMNQLDPAVGPELLTIKLWDVAQYFEVAPQSMASSSISTLPTIAVNGVEGRYNAFLTRLYSQVIYIVGMKIKVAQSGDCDCCSFPPQFDQNIHTFKVNEQQMLQDEIWLSDLENPMAYKSSLGTIGLNDQQMRLDRETAWIWDVYTGQVITIELAFVAYEHNS